MLRLFFANGLSVAPLIALVSLWLAAFVI